MSATPHPAKFSPEILKVAGDLLADLLPAPATVIDPFAGVGVGVDHLRGLGYEAWGIELEPEWADQSEWVEVGTALDLPRLDDSIDGALCSPCYGNRLSDQHDAKDVCVPCGGTGKVTGSAHDPDSVHDQRPCPRCKGKGGLSRRITYRHKLGRPLSEGSAAGLQWGRDYRALHIGAWRELYRVLRPGGIFILNCSDHIREGKRVPVTAWHVAALTAQGFEWIDGCTVQTRRMRDGANREARVDAEWVHAFRVPAVKELTLC